MYPKFLVCPSCERHGIIEITDRESSMGFTDKRTGLSALEFSREKFKISDEDYRRIYQQISLSSLPLTGENPTVQQDILMLRMTYIYAESQKGMRFSKLYQPCEPHDPKPIRSLAQVAKNQPL